MINVLEKCKVSENTTNEILTLCKKVKEDELVFVELGRDMFKDKPYILNKYFRNENGYDCYYPNLLYFKQYKSVMDMKTLKSILKDDFGKSVSLKGYKYDPNHYRFENQGVQDEYEEDLFRYPSDEEVTNNKIEALDMDAYESLNKVLFKALQMRYVMLLDLEGLPALLNDAIECFQLGVTCSYVNSLMKAKIAQIRTLLTDNSVIAWLKTGASDMSFDKVDYVSTYQKVLRQMTNIKDESFEYMKDLIHNDYDLFEDEILANETIELVSIYENTNNEDFDE